MPPAPRGSWVRLATADAGNLKDHLGKHVTIIGEIRDAGGNTIGTAGQSSPMPRAGEANGNAPRLRSSKSRIPRAPARRCRGTAHPSER